MAQHPAYEIFRHRFKRTDVVIYECVVLLHKYVEISWQLPIVTWRKYSAHSIGILSVPYILNDETYDRGW